MTQDAVALAIRELTNEVKALRTDLADLRTKIEVDIAGGAERQRRIEALERKMDAAASQRDLDKMGDNLWWVWRTIAAAIIAGAIAQISRFWAN